MRLLCLRNGEFYIILVVDYVMTKVGRKRNRIIHQISFGNRFSFETLITSSIIRFPNFSPLNLGLTYILFISPGSSLIFLKLIVPAIWPSTSTNNNQLHISIWGLQYRMIFLKFPIYLRRTKNCFHISEWVTYSKVFNKTNVSIQMV